MNVDAVEIDHGSEDDADDEMQIEDDIDIDEDREHGGDEDPAYIPKTMAAFLPVINTRRTNTSPRTAVKGAWSSCLCKLFEWISRDLSTPPLFCAADVEQTSHTEDDSSHTESDSEPPFPSTSKFPPWDC